MLMLVGIRRRARLIAGSRQPLGHQSITRHQQRRCYRAVYGHQRMRRAPFGGLPKASALLGIARKIDSDPLQLIRNFTLHRNQ